MAEDSVPPGLYFETTNIDDSGAASRPREESPERLSVENEIDFSSASEDLDYIDPLHAVRTPTKQVISEGVVNPEDRIHPVFDSPESPLFGNLGSQPLY